MDKDDVIAISEYLIHGSYPEGLSRDDKRSLRQKSGSFLCDTDEAGRVRLYHRGKQDRRQLVIYDQDEKREILHSAHLDVARPSLGRPSTTAGGAPHNGINTTLRKITERYWWRRLVDDVRRYCKNCLGCCHVGSSLVHMSSAGIVGVPFEDVSDRPLSTRPVEASWDGLVIPASQMSNSVPQRSATYTGDLLSALGELYRQGLFCDVTLTSEDGVFQTKVHKVVLVSASGYLKSLLLDPDLVVQDHITIPNVSGSCLESLVAYMYSGVLHLSADTVNVMLVVATRLEISTVVQLCHNFIENPNGTDPASDSKELATCDLANATLEPVDEEKVVVDGSTGNGKVKRNAVVLKQPVDAPVTSVPTTRSSARKLQARGSRKPDQVRYDSAADRGPQRTGNSPRHARKSPRKSADSELSRDSATCDSVLGWISPKVEIDPDWKPKVHVSSKASTHSFRVRKNSLRSVAKSYASPLQRKRLFSSPDEARSSQTARKSSRIRRSMSCSSVCQAENWQRSRKLLLSARSFLARRRKVKSGARLVCTECPSIPFLSQSRLTAHRMTKHRCAYLCVTCSCDFSTFVTFLRHRRLRHFPISQSLNVLGSRVDVKSEQDSMAVSIQNKCGWCGVRFPSRRNLIEHRKTVHRKRTDAAATPPSSSRQVMRDWNCQERDCGAKFKHKEKLRAHMAELHPNVVFSCPTCRFKTQVEHILKRHLVRRHRERHNCQMCAKAFHKPFLLRVHMYNRHRITDPSLKLYHCSHEGCNYVCPSKNGINLHGLKHTQGVAFACDVCGKTFKRQAGLEKHTAKVHLGIRPYICDKCGNSYSDEAELRAHLARHSENKPFSCDFCPYSTFQKGSLKSHLFCRHQVLMDREMPVLRCDLCSFMTDKRCRYNDHVKVHNNIRDVPCHECGKLFVTKKTLRQHVIKVHRRTHPSPSTTPSRAPHTPGGQFLIPTEVQKLGDQLRAVARSAEIPAGNFPSSSGPVEYQMLVPLASTSAGTDSAAALSQVAAVSGTGSIIVGVPLSTVDNVTAYQAFQPFDLQNARLVL